VTPCPACLRRTGLIGLLSIRISGELAPRRRAGPILALSDQDLIEAVGGSLRGPARRLLRDFDAAAAVAEIASAGLHAVCRHQPLYPARLFDLDDSPALIHTTSSPDRLAELCGAPAVAVVGTRRASAYGLEVAAAIGRGLAAAGVTVVSGLALGIDAAAHRGALEVGGPTIAVLGCGADTVYPRTNRSLYGRIRAHGAAIAELPPGHQPARWTFPARNRIMAALAQVTVVVEAAERSGSLITAGFAQDLGREVCAVPGRVTSRMAAGANQLLLDGAHLVRGAADVLDLIFGAGGWQGGAGSRNGGAGGANGGPGAGARPSEPSERLDAALERVLAAVESGDSVDEAARRARMSASELRAALGRLELLGLVRRDGLGSYERVAGR
jgi:DNA processing protein